MLLVYPLLWAVGAFATYAYCVERAIPWSTALLVLPAFLLEASFYLTVGVERLRTHLEKLRPVAFAAMLSAAAVIPYCLASLALRTFSWRALGEIAALALLASFWYIVFPRRPAVDLLFLIGMALPMLFRVFPQLYRSPLDRLPLAILGQLMWFRTGLFAMVSIRRGPKIGFGFWPTPREWRIGTLYFIALLPLAALLAHFIDLANPHPRYSGWARITVLAIATFFGILWVVALGEEFFFRGLLQQWFVAWFKNEWVALALTAILFGAVHLWFRTFPNWRFAMMAALAGLFYGMAFRQAKSIRASMVTHALTVTTWRMFFG